MLLLTRRPPPLRKRVDARLSLLQAHGTVRQLYPYGAGVRLARARAAAAWQHDPRARQDALDSMELVVGATERAGEVEELAQRHLFERYRRYELLARPRTAATFAVEGVEQVLDRPRGGPGVVLSFLHHGHFSGMCPSLERYGLELTIVSRPVPAPSHPPTVHDLRREQLHRTLSLNNASIIEAPGSYGVLVERLRAGETVAIAADLPGSTPVRFLGREFLVPSGAVRLARETGAPIVPLSSFPDGALQRVVLHEPVRPQDHPDSASLLQAVFDRHAPAALAWPEGLERPLLHFQQQGV